MARCVENIVCLKNKDQISRKTRNQNALSGEKSAPPPPDPLVGDRPRLARSAKAKVGRRSRSEPDEADQEYGGQPSMEDDLRWKRTIDGR